ncbi:MAG: hypothetical protein AAGA28_19220 [Pseudomonadota bacterium]
MTILEERRTAVTETAEEILSIIGDTPSVERLERAKFVLVALCARTELFPVQDFPIPDGEVTDRTFLIYDNADGAALYMVTSVPSQTYRPHDHGGSWAIVAMIQGETKHGMFITETGEDEGSPKLVHKTDLICSPGNAVSLMPDGIHNTESIGAGPLLHLHFYGTRFEDQSARTEYELETGHTMQFRVEDFGFIEDRR